MPLYQVRRQQTCSGVQNWEYKYEYEYIAQSTSTSTWLTSTSTSTWFQEGKSTSTSTNTRERVRVHTSRVRVQFHILLLSIDHSFPITLLLNMWSKQGLHVLKDCMYPQCLMPLLPVGLHLKLCNLQPEPPFPAENSLLDRGLSKFHSMGFKWF